MPQTNTITREKLYELVWLEPLSHLSKKYEISDNGLGKICKRMEFPKPPVGYWNRFHAGKVDKKTPLPKATKKCVLEIKLNDYQAKEPEVLPQAMLDSIEFENRPENIISKPESLIDPAKIVIRTQKAFNNAKPDNRGILEAKSQNHLAMKVSNETKDRAILLYDTIYKECEKRGYKLVLKTIEEQNGYYWYKRHETYIEAENKKFYISVSEKINQTRHIPKPEEKEKLRLKKLEEKKQERLMRSNRYYDSYGRRNIDYDLLSFKPPNMDYTPSGKLSLKITNMERRIKRHIWSDTDRVDIFSQLNDFFIGIQHGLEYFKQEKIREKKRKIAEEEYYRQRRIEEDRRWEEEKKIKKLTENADKYYEYTKLKNYLDATKAQDNKDEEFITWAEEYLQKVNPFSNGG